MSKLGFGAFTNPFGTGVGKKCKQLFIIGCDGSIQSMTCISVAAQLMDPYSDNMLILNLGDSDDEKNATHIFGKAQPLMTQAGVPIFRQACKYIKKPHSGTWSYGDMLVYFANRCVIDMPGVNAATLVVAAAGAGAQHATGARAVDQIGKVAYQCVTKVKVPVLLIKETHISKSGRGEQALTDLAKESRQRKCRATGSPGLNIMVTVDATTVSHRAFDYAVSCCRRGDTLISFHIADDKGPSNIWVPEELAKQEQARKIDTRNVTLLKQGRGIKDHVKDWVNSNQPDLTVMGSAEMSNPERINQVGSVCAAIAKSIDGHLMIVKNTH